MTAANTPDLTPDEAEWLRRYDNNKYLRDMDEMFAQSLREKANQRTGYAIDQVSKLPTGQTQTFAAVRIDCEQHGIKFGSCEDCRLNEMRKTDDRY